MKTTPVTIPERSARRHDFRHFNTMQTRWNDLDSYRHINNARYYTFFDTVIMDYLQVAGQFDVMTGPVLPFTLENACRFFHSFTFPDVIEAGLRVARLGNSSVSYQLGLFRVGSEEIYAAGYFVDVFVDAATQTPVPIPADIRVHLNRIQVTTI
jgi:acyl-CoA thioester hydrolase